MVRPDDSLQPQLARIPLAHGGHPRMDTMGLPQAEGPEAVVILTAATPDPPGGHPRDLGRDEYITHTTAPLEKVRTLRCCNSSTQEKTRWKPVGPFTTHIRDMSGSNGPFLYISLQPTQLAELLRHCITSVESTFVAPGSARWLYAT